MRRIATALALIALAAVTALAGVDSGGSHTLAAAQSATDYDDDDNRLIDVRTLAQLNAIRWDLNGNGSADASSNAASYAAAFPNPAANMGCPSAMTGNACRGYELRGDLDFDTDGSGVVDGDDSPSFPNWTPIGPSAFGFTAEFKGNNYTISNLTMRGAKSSADVGLFARSNGTITGVGLVDADMAFSSVASSFVGALVGRNLGTVRSSYATGSISDSRTALSTSNFGGLAGTNFRGTIAASWAAVSIDVSSINNDIGGLVGYLNGGTVIACHAAGAARSTGNSTVVGGLAGVVSGAAVSHSYAVGPVSSTGSGGSAGGLFGRATGNNTIAASYWDVGTTGIADDADSAMPEGVATSDLQSITSYTGVFADWNANVDGQTGADDPWEFGTAMQYPRLKFGFDTGGQVAQGSLVMGTPGTNGDNPVVGQVARVCLLAGPTQRAAGTGGATYAPWQWYRSTDGVSWGNPITKTGPTYDYMPVAGDAGNYLRACVDVVSSAGAERVLGDDRVCVGPFAKVQASGGS